jgi:hypothetical protein
MANDELQAMVRDELFWDPRVDGDAVAVSGKRRRGHPMSTAKAKPPERVSRCRRAARAQTSGRARRCNLLPPDRRLRGSCRTAVPARWSLWNLSKYDDYCPMERHLLPLELSE